MTEPRRADVCLPTRRLELRPLPGAAAALLPDDRQAVSRLLGVELPPSWPLADLLDVLPMQAAAGQGEERFGVWLMIEPASRTVVGDIGFMGPPGADGVVEVGFSVIPERRGRGYAAEAAGALVRWALAQPGIRSVVARCDRDNTASVRTLERAGFGRTSEAGGQIAWRATRDA